MYLPNNDKLKKGTISYQTPIMLFIYFTACLWNTKMEIQMLEIYESLSVNWIWNDMSLNKYRFFIFIFLYMHNVNEGYVQKMTLPLRHCQWFCSEQREISMWRPAGLSLWMNHLLYPPPLNNWTWQQQSIYSYYKPRQHFFTLEMCLCLEEANMSKGEWGKMWHLLKWKVHSVSYK